MATTQSSLPSASRAPHTVLVLVFPGFQLLDASGPLEVFAAVSAQPAPAFPAYRLRVVSIAGGPVASSAGLTVLTEPLPELDSLAGGTLIVAGGFGVQRAALEGVLAPWLVQAAKRVARCCSVCTGAFLLGQAGLLDGRSAVTHWRYVETLKGYFPKARVFDDALFIKDGPIYTSAGVTAGIDLCLSLVEEDHGREVSLQVAKNLVMYLQRPGGQRQFSAALRAQSTVQEGLVAELTRWLGLRLHEDISIDSMAAALAVSPRTLHRRCKQALGSTPAKYLFQLRLDAACRLLEAGATSLKRVAEKTGFGSEYNLRRAFGLGLKVTPSEYRLRFCR